MTYVRRMNWIERQCVVGFGGILWAAMVQADVTEPAANPYDVIHVRNPFALKPPEKIGPVGPTNPVVPSNVKLTGFSSDSTGKNWKVWLMIPAQPGKNPQYFNLMEHEKQGDIEVLEINEKENTVKILNGGNPAELTVKDNGLPTPAAPLVPGVPMNPGAPGGPVPGIVPPPGTYQPGIKTAGVVPGGTAPNYGATPSPITPVATPYRTIPSRNVRTSPIVEPQAQAAPSPVDPVAQRLIMEAQKKQAEREGRPFPPLPPIPGQP